MTSDSRTGDAILTVDARSVHRPIIAWIILAISLLITALAWYMSRQYVNGRAQDRFSYRVKEIQEAIRGRMLEYEQVLRGGMGLFAASENVNRHEWHEYVANSRLQQYYPGIQGMGVSVPVRPEEKEAHIRKIRAEGFPEFTIHPAGQRNFYTSIIYLEPFDWRNQRAFGYDMYSEPNRRAAIDRAINTGRASISGMITLVQETDDDVQNGFLYYLPMYKPNVPLANPTQRRAAFTGLVYAAFRVDDLMHGILGSENSDVEFEIFDGETLAKERLLYSSDGTHHQADVPVYPKYTATRDWELSGRKWTLYFVAQPAFLSWGEHAQSLIVGFVGLVVDALLFLVIGSLSRQHERAVRLAKSMTRELRESQEQFRAVSDNANDAIISTDSKGMILYGNSAATCYFGYPDEELLGQPLSMLIPNWSQDLNDNGVSKDPDHMRKSGRVEPLDEVGLRKDGSMFPLAMSIAGWDAGGRSFFAATIRDTTDFKRMEKDREQYMRGLERSNQELEQFAYVASHDLQEPLRKVTSFCQLLRAEYAGRLEGDADLYIDFAVDGAARMSSLISDLLSYSRIESQGKPLEPTDADTVCDSAISNLEIAILESGAVVTHDPLPQVFADRSQLTPLFQNLIDNAIKYCDDSRSPVVHVGSEIIDGDVRFCVSDNGIGFESQYSERIFAIFQRLHACDAYSGTGIGLAVCRKIVDRVGGRIWAESEPGQGSQFFFTIAQVSSSCHQNELGNGQEGRHNLVTSL